MLIAGQTNFARATDPNQTGPSAAQTLIPSLSEEPTIRWAQLYNLLFEHRPGLTLTTEYVQSILASMAELEANGELFNSLSRRRNQMGSQQYFAYKELSKILKRNKLLYRWNSSVTKTILQTFNVTVANCSELNLKKMRDLVGMMANYPMGPIIELNLQVQYKECWQRYLKIMDDAFALLSKKEGHQLIAALDGIQLGLDDLLPEISEASVSKPIESAQQAIVDKFAPTISALVLKSIRTRMKNAVADYDYEYIKLFRDPCVQLLGVVKPVFIRVGKIFEFIGGRRNFMLVEHLKLLNLYRLCSRITVDKQLRRKVFNMCQATARLRSPQTKIMIPMSKEPDPVLFETKDEFDYQHEPQINSTNELIDLARAATQPSTSRTPQMASRRNIDNLVPKPGMQSIQQLQGLGQSLAPLQRSNIAPDVQDQIRQEPNLAGPMTIGQTPMAIEATESTHNPSIDGTESSDRIHLSIDLINRRFSEEDQADQQISPDFASNRSEANLSNLAANSALEDPGSMWPPILLNGTNGDQSNMSDAFWNSLSAEFNEADTNPFEPNSIINSGNVGPERQNRVRPRQQTTKRQPLAKRNKQGPS